VNFSTTAGGGGAVKTNGGFINATSTTFDANSAIGTTTGFDGGAIQLAGAGSKLTLTNSTVSNNQSSHFGGRIATTSGTAASITLSGATVTLNKANTGTVGYGGGIYISTGGTTFTVADSQISSNTASNNGGGVVALNGAKVSITNSSVINNQGISN